MNEISQVEQASNLPKLNTQDFLVLTELSSRPESLTARDAAPGLKGFWKHMGVAARLNFQS